MRQVPTDLSSHLLVGGGRVARHVAYYYQLLGHKLPQWNRRQHSKEELACLLDDAKVVHLAIPDSAINSFYQKWKKPGVTFTHFSGALYHTEILDFHPLMTFDTKNYDLQTYQTIHFVGTPSKESFQSSFPFLPNEYNQLQKEHKAKYHGLCVLVGNGTTLLWDIFDKEFEKLGLPREASRHYLIKVFHNILQNNPGRFSGPWYRNDKDTLTKNLAALEDDHLDLLYREMLKLSQTRGCEDEKRIGL